MVPCDNVAVKIVRIGRRIGNESVPIQLAQCRFFGLTIFNAKIGNDSVPKILINDTINLFLKLQYQHFANFKP